MIQKLALAITIIGALNWGVVGLFNFDVVAQFANGHAEPVARFFYFIVGISGLLTLGLLFNTMQDKNTETVTVAEPEEA
ncbi:DUF378 domain-containing protein [Sporosarcina sp. ACRSL]|uniref:DUF378 domain-containing protein n=1 Tax=Sporosarcina sp. ACRSL TaxID=2918215 RepID=UPI001EF464C4|nr:DUF378 domain-containing protein [Sporosarcina sp. ACRSL]MCG7346574.1 DUF378 domain-containing protein [Sporosarcina sp. ACRSL]